MRCTNNDHWARRSIGNARGVILRLIVLGAVTGLLGACAGMKNLNPIPESWRGTGESKAGTEQASHRTKDNQPQDNSPGVADRSSCPM
ncbi:MAG: hypothetical protein EBX64_03415, partial [Betaproteobacteria bacterium]|nr:hypothetical protein [Betaproteobacteria bacterium]